jgi:hypothetical protein
MSALGFSRRDFLKGAGGAAALLALSCAPTKDALMESLKSLPQVQAAPPVVYPTLPDQKVQAPKFGCYTGMRRLSTDTQQKEEAIKRVRSIQSLDELITVSNEVGPVVDKNQSAYVTHDLEYYKNAFGRYPGIFALSGFPKLYMDFPDHQVSAVTSKGVIPYVNFYPMSSYREGLILDLKGIAEGKFDDRLTNLAKGAAEFGEKHGGFFVTTMEEMNGFWYPWGQHAKYIPAWQHIWQLFEDQGANKYVTWVWEPFCLEPEVRLDHFYRMQPPEKYYPGDKYVDWIGFSAFSRRGYSGDGMRHRDLISRSLDEMHTNHRDKPIMHAETGRTRGYDQERWLIDAFRTIKSEMPELKAVVYWDNVTTTLNDDKTLSEDSLKVMKHIFQDPYWIMARDV